MEFRNCYYHAIWFVGNPAGDWMGQLFKDGGKWVFEYRFRYCDPANPDASPFEFKDRKKWYAFATEDDSDAELARIVDVLETKFLPVLEMRYGNKMECVELKCDQSNPRFFIELASREWCHVKQVTAEEFEAMTKAGKR